MTTTNLNPNSSNFSQIKAMFEGPKTKNEPPKVFKNNGLSSVTNTTKPEAQLPSPKAKSPEGKKSPPAVPEKTAEAKKKYKLFKQQYEANLLSKSPASKVAKPQATPKGQKPPVPPKRTGQTKPPVPAKRTGLTKPPVPAKRTGQTKPPVPAKRTGLTKPPVPLTEKSGMSNSPASSIKPRNSEEQAKIHENDRAEKLKEILQKISARKIQTYFREHLEKLSKIETNSCGYKMTTYDGNYETKNVEGKGNRKHQGTNFYFKTGDQGTEHVLYSPAEKPVKRLEGACKYVAGMDKRFVALKLNFLQKLTMSLNKNYNNYNDLTGTSTVIPGIAVDTDTIISRFGGDNLSDYLQKKNFINPARFENSVKDLKTLHKKNTYLTDIKIENLTYDGKNVNFIDIENRVKIDPVKSNIIQPHMTPCCTTTKLLRVLRPDAFGGLSHSFSFTPDEAAAKKPYLKVCDEYAFLLSMIEATTRKSESKIAFNAVPIENIEINGIMNDNNERYFHKWIQNHVKPEFHSNVESILRDPHEYAEKSSNPPYLSDMLLFKGSYNA